MVVNNMNSRRIRKPNVRLWDVGDFSAALACTVSTKRFTKKKFGLEKWLYDPNFDQESSEHTNLCPRMLEDENKNPNSAIVSYKPKPKLDFGTVTRKGRSVNRRRRRRSEHSSSNPFGCQWRGETEFKDSSNDVTPSMSKERDNELLRMSESEFNTEMQCKSNESVGAGTDKAKNEFGNVNGVKGWLEELGFRCFATLFEIHEVDEEALLLLTMEDLKDMGIVAVGPRRKLFVAIEQLRDANKYIN